MPTATATIGAMRERIMIQTPVSQSIVVSSLTSSGTTATATTASAHGYATGDYVTVAGATPAGYNGTVPITVTGTTTFTYTVASGLTTPATGTIRVVYASDAQGGRAVTWTTLYSAVPAELTPLRSAERLQAASIGAHTGVRFRVRVRTDLLPSMRVLWTPSWPEAASEQTLEIHGILPYDDGRVYQLLDCGVVT